MRDLIMSRAVTKQRRTVLSGAVPSCAVPSKAMSQKEQTPRQPESSRGRVSGPGRPSKGRSVWPDNQIVANTFSPC